MSFFEGTKLDQVFRHTVSLNVSKIKKWASRCFFSSLIFSLIESIYRVTYCFVGCICVYVCVSVGAHTRDTHIYISLNFQFSIFPLSRISPKRKSYDPKRRERCLDVCVCLPSVTHNFRVGAVPPYCIHTQPTSESFVTS